MKNKIEDLRNHLFTTLEALNDPDKPMDLERAKTVAQVVINTAKVEVDFINATGARASTGFIPMQPIADRTSDPDAPGPRRPAIAGGRT